MTVLVTVTILIVRFNDISKLWIERIKCYYNCKIITLLLLLLILQGSNILPQEMENSQMPVTAITTKRQ